jgi:hypothetical protein
MSLRFKTLPQPSMIEMEWTNIMLSAFGWPGNYNLLGSISSLNCFLFFSFEINFLAYDYHVCLQFFPNDIQSK